MIWTGKGVLHVFDGKKVIHPGDKIPDDALDKDRVIKFKKAKKIDGRLSPEAYEKALAQVKENKRKLAAGPVKGDKSEIKKADNIPKSKKDEAK